MNSSVVRIPELVERVDELGMSAVALTDFNNVCGAIRFYKAAVKHDVKPVFGSEVIVRVGEDGVLGRLVLLCQNRLGFENLSTLLSTAYLRRSPGDRVIINERELADANEGLIAFPPPIGSDIAHYLFTSSITSARARARQWKAVFGSRYYLAVQRTERTNDETYLTACLSLGIELDVPLIACNETQFLKAEEFQAQDVRTCIATRDVLDNSKRVRHYSSAQYLKSPLEMRELFSDLPEILENTVEVSIRCNLHFSSDKRNHLLAFPTPDDSDPALYFERLARTGLEKRLAMIKDDTLLGDYQRRLEYEIKVIRAMYFESYFLTVADIVQWARETGIPVGPGRGSGSGSLVAYALKITQIDPIKHDLLFERFLNPDRISMPDFDIDFCADRRDEVIERVKERYGRERVTQIITYGAMAAKGVVRDVGRVLGYPYSFCDTISKLIPSQLNITLEQTMSGEKEGGSDELVSRYQAEEQVRTLIDLSRKIEGLKRNIGTHAGGVVIAPVPMEKFCPVYKGDKVDDVVVSQFDKDDIEHIGLIKFDFLGLSALTTIQKAVVMIKKHLGCEVDVDALALDDPKVYKLLRESLTAGIFQLESEGIKAYLEKLGPDCFEDIVAMLALYRPGPLETGMVEQYISVKKGAKVRYPHPLLKQILSPTNGVILYQEQVMRTAQVMAGYSLSEADILRRAMGKKQVDEMNRQREIFVAGAFKNNIDAEAANRVFDLMETFAGYGFNKSHSVAYAHISYQTAWLKTHYPAAYMASVMTGLMDDTDRLGLMIREVRSLGLLVGLPDINASDLEFKIKDTRTIVYGLGAIKGVGKGLVQAIVLERSSGPYLGLFDFCERVPKGFFSKRALEALIFCGSFDQFGIHRASLGCSIERAQRAGGQKQEDCNSGQMGLFGAEAPSLEHPESYINAPSLSACEASERQRGVMGYYFMHPMRYVGEEVRFLRAQLPTRVVGARSPSVRVLGLLEGVSIKRQLGGKQMAQCLLTDEKTILPATVFSEHFEAMKANLVSGTLVIAEGGVSADRRGGWQLIITGLTSFEAAKIDLANELEIQILEQNNDQLSELKHLLLNFKGEKKVVLRYQNKDAEAVFKMPDCYRVEISRELMEKVDALLGGRVSRLRFSV